MATTTRPRPTLALAIGRPGQTARERAAGTIDRDVHEAAFTNHGIDIEVAWDGVTAQFKVLDTRGAWVGVEDLAVDDRNSVIKPPKDAQPVMFHARFRRAAPHACCPFRVRIIPIEWQVEGSSEEERQQAIGELLADPQFTAIRDEHYVCDETGDSGYQPSTESDNRHALCLELQVGTDYEVWVELQHPIDPTADWCVIDPIVTTGNSGDGHGE
ncbi:MAG: hypothetical protein MJE77_13295 [Proteobacteria bacterium]|nr:hypothetical protein [Pseudomonadota bacterium]